MTISRISLVNFRTYADAIIAPTSGLIIISGDNGSGKTNLLEAVSLLSPGRGLRGVPLAAMARDPGPGSFSVSARIGEIDIGTGTAAAKPDRRLVRINKAQASASSLAEWLSVIWLTPAMDRLFLDSAGNRRRFLDRLVLASSPRHAIHSSRYDAAMRQRNRLLAEERAADPQWLTALELQMAEHGLAIAEARTHLVMSLSCAIGAAAPSAFPRAQLALEGWQDGDLAEHLRANRARDAAASRALVGPHCSDLRVRHLEKDIEAAQCSTGEQKALLLGIILAHADLVAQHVDRRPILLLDEVAAHLDAKRRAALFERLAISGSQVFMTGTEIGLFEAADPSAAHFTIKNGQAVRLF